MQNIQHDMEVFFKSSCYAYCIAYVYGKKDIFSMTQAILEGWEMGYIEADGYVSKPHKFASYCMGIPGYFKDVRKPKTHLNEGLKIVEYQHNTQSHFVVQQDGTVIFDPAGDSNTVKYGVPVSWRNFIV